MLVCVDKRIGNIAFDLESTTVGEESYQEAMKIDENIKCNLEGWATSKFNRDNIFIGV